MNTNKIFTGNIMRNNELICTTVFLKCKNNIYVPIDNIKSIWDIYKINRKKSEKITKHSQNTTMYVDENSLQPYYPKTQYKSLRKIKLDVLLDARNPAGINH